MCKKLPIGEFKWRNPNEYSEEKIKNYDEDGSIGSILKADIAYPKHLHDLHKDHSFLCERRKLSKTTKLVTTLDDKKDNKSFTINILKIQSSIE